MLIFGQNISKKLIGICLNIGDFINMLCHLYWPWCNVKENFYYWAVKFNFWFIFRENFERAYIEATEQFYSVKAPQQLALEADGAGVFGYMKWAEAKLREEEQRALKYLETTTGSATPGVANGPTTPAAAALMAAANAATSSSVQNLVDSCVSVLVTSHKETILSECADMIRANETEKLQLMFKLMDRVPDEGIDPMLSDLEAHIYANGIADMVESADVITQDSEKYVEKLLALFRRFSQLVSDAFR